jgi:predicted amidohydrolase YtcJ
MTAASCGQQEKGDTQAWKTVEGGTIDVDNETGLPTGILREAAAPLVTSLVTGTMTMEQQIRRVLWFVCFMLTKSAVWASV